MSFGSDMESPIKRQNSYTTPDFAGILVINVPLDTRLPARIIIPPFYNRIVKRSICLTTTLVELKGWSREYARSIKLAERRALVEVELWDKSEMANLFSPSPVTFSRRTSYNSPLTTATEEAEPQVEVETHLDPPHDSLKRGSDHLELSPVDVSPSFRKLRPRKQPRFGNPLEESDVTLPFEEYVEGTVGKILFADHFRAAKDLRRKLPYDEAGSGNYDLSSDGSTEKVNKHCLNKFMSDS